MWVPNVVIVDRPTEKDSKGPGSNPHLQWKLTGEVELVKKKLSLNISLISKTLLGLL